MIDADHSPVAVHIDQTGSNSCEIGTRSIDELDQEIVELCTHIHAATYRLLRAIAEFERRKAWGWGFQSTAHWLTRRVDIDMVTAGEKVRAD